MLFKWDLARAHVSRIFASTLPRPTPERHATGSKKCNGNGTPKCWGLAGRVKKPRKVTLFPLATCPRLEERVLWERVPTKWSGLRGARRWVFYDIVHPPWILRGCTRDVRYRYAAVCGAVSRRTRWQRTERVAVATRFQRNANFQ
jgi:hypothetical protein